MISIYSLLNLTEYSYHFIKKNAYTSTIVKQ